MGIDIGSALVVGLPAEDFCANYDEFDDKYECELDCISPYYDADFEYCLIGVKIAGKDFTYNELPDNISDVIEKAKEKFKQITGKDAKVYVTPHVW